LGVIYWLHKNGWTTTLVICFLIGFSIVWIEKPALPNAFLGGILLSAIFTLLIKFWQNPKSKMKIKGTLANLKLLGIDGNNVYMEAIRSGLDVDGSFKIIIDFLKELDAKDVEHHLFWDAKFNDYAIKEGFKDNNEDLRTFLSHKLKLDIKKITIPPKNQRADDHFIPWCEKTGAGVLTNDLFNKDEDQLIKEAAAKLRRHNRILPFSVTPQSIIVPGITWC